MWFYLNGTHPSRAGLAVIADSHRADWQPPDGFEFTADQRSFHRTGEEPKPYDRMDMPGTVPLFTEPGDLIIFAARTYHGAFPHGGDEPRLSCGFIFRPTQEKLSIPWELPESAHRFMEGLSPTVAALRRGLPKYRYRLEASGLSLPSYRIHLRLWTT